MVITGHTGFKGAWLALWLKKMGAKVYGISKSETENGTLYNSLKQLNFEKEYYIDIIDSDKTVNILSVVRPDFIFHLAAQPIVSVAYQSPFETMATNTLGTASILQYLTICEHPTVAVMITSDKCYENIETIWGYKETDKLGGADPYSASKAMAELAISSYFRSFLVTRSNIKLGIARAGNVIGGGDFATSRLVPDCIKSWQQKKPVEIKNPKATRPWQHVLEPLSGYLLLGQLLQNDACLNGEAFNFGPGKDSNKTVIDLISLLSNGDADKCYEILQEPSFQEAQLLQLNCEKALAYLRWSPVLSFEEACAFTREWFFDPDNEKEKFSLNQISEYEKLARLRKIVWAC